MRRKIRKIRNALTQEPPLPCRAHHVRRIRVSRGENFIPPTRIIDPRNLLNKSVPPQAVARSRILDPHRAQLRFDLDPDVRPSTGLDFFRGEFARADRANKSRGTSARVVDPTGFALRQILANLLTGS